MCGLQSWLLRFLRANHQGNPVSSQRKNNTQQDTPSPALPPLAYTLPRHRRTTILAESLPHRGRLLTVPPQVRPRLHGWKLPWCTESPPFSMGAVTVRAIRKGDRTRRMRLSKPWRRPRPTEWTLQGVPSRINPSSPPPLFPQEGWLIELCVCRFDVVRFPRCVNQARISSPDGVRLAAV